MNININGKDINILNVIVRRMNKVAEKEKLQHKKYVLVEKVKFLQSGALQVTLMGKNIYLPQRELLYENLGEVTIDEFVPVRWWFGELPLKKKIQLKATVDYYYFHAVLPGNSFSNDVIAIVSRELLQRACSQRKTNK